MPLFRVANLFLRCRFDFNYEDVVNTRSPSFFANAEHKMFGYRHQLTQLSSSECSLERLSVIGNVFVVERFFNCLLCANCGSVVLLSVTNDGVYHVPAIIWLPYAVQNKILSRWSSKLMNKLLA